MTKTETKALAEVATDVKWIVKTLKDNKVDFNKLRDDHDKRITNVSRRTWMIVGGLTLLGILYGNGFIL